MLGGSVVYRILLLEDGAQWFAVANTAVDIGLHKSGQFLDYLSD